MLRNPNDMPETHQLGQGTEQWGVTGQIVAALERHHLLAVGRTLARDGLAFVRHAPPFGLVQVCVGGHGQVFLEGDFVFCATGMAYLTPPNVFHAYRTTGIGEWEFVWLMYAPDGSPLASLPKPVLVSCDPKPLGLSVEGLYHESTHGKDRTAIEGWLELAAHYGRALVESVRTTDRLTSLWAKVEKDLARSWTADDLARAAAMSKEQLRRLSLRETNRSPIEQVAWLRMQRASLLLGDAERSIEAIAAAVGYESAFAFSRAFKRWCGQPPSVHREKVLGTAAAKGPKATRR